MGTIGGKPLAHKWVYANVLQHGTNHTHQSTTGNEARSDKGTPVAPLLINLCILRASGNKPTDEATHQQRCVEFQRYEHTQRKGQCGHANHSEDERESRTCEVEHPRSYATRHQGLNHGGHSVGLGSNERTLAGETIGLVEHHHHTCHSGCRHQCAEEFPTLLLLGGCAHPVADFQVGNKAARHTQCGADHTTDNHRCGHTALALQADAHKYKRGQNEGHQSHTAHGVATHNGNGVGGNGGEEEGNHKDHQQRNGRHPPVAQHTDAEEYKGCDEHGNEYGQDGAHRDVLVGTLLLCATLLAFEFAHGHTERVLDYARLLDNADDTCHSDTANTEGLTNVGKEVLGGKNLLWVGQQTLVGDTEQCHEPCGIETTLQRAHHRHHHKPHKERACADEGSIFEAHDVAQAEHSGRGVNLEDGLELLGSVCAPSGDAGGEGVGPQAEGAHHKVIQTTNQTTHGQQFGLSLLALATDEHLGSGSSLGERIFAVHLLHKVLAEGNEQHNTQQATQQRGEENLIELGLQAENVECRQGEDGTCHNHTTRCTNALDDDVLTEHILLACHGAHAHGDDGDGDGGLKDLAHLQSEVGGCCREDYGHQHTHTHRVGSNLFGLVRGLHNGHILLALGKGAIGVFGQLFDLFLFRHSSILF